MPVELLPKKTRGNVVVAEMTLRFGDEKSLTNRVLAGQITSQLLLRGTAKHSRQQLQDEFDKLKAKVSLSNDVNFVTVSIETTRDNLPAVMQLLAEALREPSFPAAEFEQLKQERLAAYERERTDPEALAMARIRRILNPYPPTDPRAVALPDESIAALKLLTLEDVKRFHADFWGGQFGECAVVGDFDDKAFAKLADELFSGWRNKTPYARLVKPFRAIAPAPQTIETPDKANA